MRSTSALLVVLLVAISAAGFVAGCGSNRAGTLLLPSGEIPTPAIGVISGRVDFGDGTYPPTLVIIARVQNCTSAFGSMQIIGTFTSWNEATSPLLTQLAPCVWADTLSLPEGAIEWKFRGDLSWSNPFGSPGTAQDGLQGCAARGATGLNDNLRATVSASSAGTRVCVLEEGRSCTRIGGGTGVPYAFFALGEPGSPALLTSATDGTFRFGDLPQGTYNVQIRAPGRPPRTITGVVVGEAPANLGTISFGSGNTGGIQGSIVFDPARFPDLASPPWQPVTVRLLQGTLEVGSVTTTRTDKTFSFTSLAPGTYDVVADANVFKLGSVANITVTTSVVDAGSLTLLRETAELATQLHVAGDFNTFAILPAWQMTQSPVGIWTVTSPDPIAAGAQNMKFVTDASFDNPTDYGGNESVTIDVPVTNGETRLVGGVGTALRLNFAAGGLYRFTLDERRQTFTIEVAPAPALGATRQED